MDLFTLSIEFLLVNIQIRSLDLAILHNLSMSASNSNLWSIIRPSNSTSVVFLISMAFILRMKHLSSLGSRIINRNLFWLAFTELYLNQLKIIVMSYLRFYMTVPNSLSQL